MEYGNRLSENKGIIIIIHYTAQENSVSHTYIHTHANTHIISLFSFFCFLSMQKKLNCVICSAETKDIKWKKTTNTQQQTNELNGPKEHTWGF